MGPASEKPFDRFPCPACGHDPSCDDVSLEEMVDTWRQVDPSCRIGIYELGKKGFLIQIKALNGNREVGPGPIREILHDSIQQARALLPPRHQGDA